MPPSNELEFWTIYWNPSDYPELFVARRWVIRPGSPAPIPTATLQMSNSIEAVRLTLPPGLYQQVRSPDDDPAIVESWF